VKKVQQALNQLDQANLIEDGIYGSRTAAAVLAYKRARSIVNLKYQTEADNIVGKMTIEALDRELLGLLDPKVIIGRPSFRPILSFAVTQSPVASIAADVSAVIRGNPHVSANASVTDGLPPSVPPGQSYQVDVSVIPPLTGSDFIDLEIINTSPLDGIAVINPKRIQSSTKVMVLGNRQTEPGNAAKLQIQASLNGKVLATSNGFSVCAYPKSIKAEPGIEVDDLSGIGMIVKETLESDSGASSHLDQVEWTEIT
jgi:hypothetical protein